MILYTDIDTTPVAHTLPNPSWGYSTDIEMALDYSELGNGKVSAFDNGVAYDKYSFKGKWILTESQVQDMFSVYSTKRGTELLLKAGTGFYPFTVGMVEPTNGYPVYISSVKNKGAVDKLGTQFQVDITFVLAYDYVITWKDLDSGYCRLGNLEFADYTEIMAPQGGYKPKHILPVSVQTTHGGSVYGMNLVTTHDEKTSGFTLELRDIIASNILNKLVNTYRKETITINGATNYFIFGEDSGDDTDFDVKLSKGKLTIKHKAHESHSIKIEVVKV